jgi:hypothetical protein
MQCFNSIFRSVYSNGLLTPKQSLKREDHPLSAAVITYTNISAITPHICRQFALFFMVMYNYPITVLDRSRGFQDVAAPRFLDNRHMKVVRLPALRTGRI